MRLRPPRFLIPRLVWRAHRRTSVRRYLEQLPRQLVEDYGHGGPYRPKQVEATIGRNKAFTAEFRPYAEVLFSEPTDVVQAWRKAGLELDYGLVRRWLGDAFFGGDPDFTAAKVARWAVGDDRWPCDPTPNLQVSLSEG